MEVHDIAKNDAQTLIHDMLIRAVSLKVAHDATAAASPTVEDIGRVIASAINHIILPAAETTSVQRYMLRYCVGSSASSEEPVPEKFLTLSPETGEPLFLGELRDNLSAILHVDPSSILASMERCANRIQTVNPLDEETIDTAERMLHAAGRVLADPQKKPAIQILELLELRHDIGTLIEGGEPGTLIYPAPPMER